MHHRIDTRRKSKSKPNPATSGFLQRLIKYLSSGNLGNGTRERKLGLGFWDGGILGAKDEEEERCVIEQSISKCLRISARFRFHVSSLIFWREAEGEAKIKIKIEIEGRGVIYD